MERKIWKSRDESPTDRLSGGEKEAGCSNPCGRTFPRNAFSRNGVLGYFTGGPEDTEWFPTCGVLA